ncbi:hypothetical protein V8D89_003947 [Ganoderma adspersum]
MLSMIWLSAPTKGNALVAIKHALADTSDCRPVGLRGYFNVSQGTFRCNGTFLHRFRQASCLSLSQFRLTPEGIAKGKEVEHMLEGRTMPELVHLPNGQVLIANSAHGLRSDNTGPRRDLPIELGLRRPYDLALHAPAPARGNRGLSPTDIARVYHSSITPTPKGNFLIEGSNSKGNFTAPVAGIKLASELRVETLHPLFMFVDRPKILSVSANVPFHTRVTVPISFSAVLHPPLTLSWFPVHYDSRQHRRGRRA